MQFDLFERGSRRHVKPLKPQLLKWVGNKQRFAHEIISYFPATFGAYYEPFLGSAGVLATLAPTKAFASDAFEPLMAIWQALHDDPTTLKRWYAERWHALSGGDKVIEYERIKASYNAQPNGPDLLFLCRSCYGGVVRFRKGDGYMSTPCGIHNPIPPDRFARRVDLWHDRTKGTRFALMGYDRAVQMAEPGDVVYCDPPYTHSQGILYGAQSFDLARLFEMVRDCKKRGVYVALSIDGTKKSGDTTCTIAAPKGLFEREVFVNCGRSMLRRFQMSGKTLESEVVADRLLLTY